MISWRDKTGVFTPVAPVGLLANVLTPIPASDPDVGKETAENVPVENKEAESNG